MQSHNPWHSSEIISSSQLQLSILYPAKPGPEQSQRYLSKVVCAKIGFSVKLFHVGLYSTGFSQSQPSSFSQAVR